MFIEPCCHSDDLMRLLQSAAHLEALTFSYIPFTPLMYGEHLPLRLRALRFDSLDWSSANCLSLLQGLNQTSDRFRHQLISLVIPYNVGSAHHAEALPLLKRFLSTCFVQDRTVATELYILRDSNHMVNVGDVTRAVMEAGCRARSCYICWNEFQLEGIDQVNPFVKLSAARKVHYTLAGCFSGDTDLNGPRSEHVQELRVRRNLPRSMPANLKHLCVEAMPTVGNPILLMNNTVLLLQQPRTPISISLCELELCWGISSIDHYLQGEFNLPDLSHFGNLWRISIQANGNVHFNNVLLGTYRLPNLRLLELNVSFDESHATIPAVYRGQDLSFANLQSLRTTCLGGLPRGAQYWITSRCLQELSVSDEIKPWRRSNSVELTDAVMVILDLLMALCDRPTVVEISVVHSRGTPWPLPLDLRQRLLRHEYCQRPSVFGLVFLGLSRGDQQRVMRISTLVCPTERLMLVCNGNLRTLERILNNNNCIPQSVVVHMLQQELTRRWFSRMCKLLDRLTPLAQFHFFFHGANQRWQSTQADQLYSVFGGKALLTLLS